MNAIHTLSELFGFAVVALVLGMRHGVDADHLAAIDAMTRCNAQARPALARRTGLWFSVGHGTVVLAVAFGVALTAHAWAAPECMKLRLDVSAQVASRLADTIDPRDLLELAAADAASEETRRTVERAESRQQALALLLMSPEFQRR